MLRCKNGRIRECSGQTRRIWKQNGSRVCKSRTQTLLRRSNNDLSRRAVYVRISCGDGVKREDDSLPLDALPFCRARALLAVKVHRARRARWNARRTYINGSRITRMRNGTLGTCGHRPVCLDARYKPSLKTLARFLASCHVQDVERIAKNYAHRVM